MKWYFKDKLSIVTKHGVYINMQFRKKKKYAYIFYKVYEVTIFTHILDDRQK